MPTPRQRALAALLFLIAGVLGGCDEPGFPRDPDGTLETVLSTGAMTVAAVDHPPWVTVSDDALPSGAEVALLEAFAEDLGVEIEWRRLSAFAALEGLEQGEFDLAIGGFTESDITPHAGAAPTYAYFTEALVVASRSGTRAPPDLEGQAVFVPPEVMAARLVRDQGAVPTAAMGDDVALAAVPHWRLEILNLRPIGTKLREEKHVMAVPQGENGWLMRLERFLRSRAAGMDDRLREH